MQQSKNKFSTKTIVLIGLFSAICYVTLFFKIPIPAPVGKPFLHMGNMFVILAALLFSGTIGGLSGSIGMGLFDFMNGYVDSVPKTLLLKFGIGFITGIVASKGHKENAKSPLKWIALSSAVLILAGISLFFVAMTYGNEIKIEGIEKAFVVIPVLYIFSLILGIALAVTCFFIKKIDIKLQYAIIGAVAGIAFNLVGEFLFGSIKLILLGSGVIPALISAAISLPATLINGTFSIVVAIILYVPLSKLLKKLQFSL
ncbi:MAG: ECF transporter S component [Cellulosilyticaceae bacterium]